MTLKLTKSWLLDNLPKIHERAFLNTPFELKKHNIE